jgi:intracellular multiplication protein IcmB
MISEIALRLSAMLLRQHVWSYSDLETADGQHNLVCDNGSLVSVFSLDGLRQIPGAEEYERSEKAFGKLINVCMGRPGHSLQFVYERDPERTRGELERVLRPARQSAKRIGLEVQDLITDNIQVLGRHTRWESCHMAIWTHRTAVPEENLKAEAKRHAEARAKVKSVYADTINPAARMTTLQDRHNSACEGAMRLLDAGDMIARRLDVHEASRGIAQQVDRTIAGTETQWHALFPQDGIKPRAKPVDDSDLSDFGFPPLSRQICRRPHERVGPTEVRIGGKFYTTIMVSHFPEESDTLFRRLLELIPETIPFRVSLRLSPLNAVSLGLKKGLALYSQWLGDGNKLIKRSCDHIQNLIAEGGKACTLQMSVVIWADSLTELRTRAAIVTQSVESWGICQTKSDYADPSESVLTSCVAFSQKAPGDASYAPLNEALNLLPIDRAGSHWKSGSILFRTPDGKIWPYEPASREQSAHIDLIVAGPGSGKSVLLSASSLALMLKAGNEEMPYISTVDVGYSSRGMLRYIRACLPPEKQHLVTEYKFTLESGEGVNPFDLQLGAYRPTPLEREFIINFLVLLITPAGRREPSSSTRELVELVVDEAYARMDAPGYRKRYEAHHDKELDREIQEIGLDPDTESLSWLEVRDRLFAAGREQAAVRAQRYAVPLINDLSSVIADSHNIQALYGDKAGLVTAENELILNNFMRMLSSAISNYPLLSRPTSIDFGNSAIISVDLNDVAKGNPKQAAIFYMLARQLCAKNFFLSEDNLIVFAEQYVGYQRERIAKIRGAVKRINYDEFHRTGELDSLRRQIKEDIREGRKWGVQVSFASQRLDDFDADMRDLATNIYFAGSMTTNAIQTIKTAFGLTDTETSVFRAGLVHGPKDGGPGMLFKYAAKGGWRSQVVRFTKGGRELWACSTTPADDELREAVLAQVDMGTALSALAEFFPSGSAEAEIELRRQRMGATASHIGDDGRSQGVIKELAYEVIARYREGRRARSDKQMAKA